MCLGIPGQVQEFLREDRQIAQVDVSGVRRKVNVALLLEDGLDIGDWVLVHVGFAISRIDEKEAAETLELLQALGEFDGEFEGFSGSDIA